VFERRLAQEETEDENVLAQQARIRTHFLRVLDALVLEQNQDNTAEGA
jgi:DNA repair protein SbcD/Mre11